MEETLTQEEQEFIEFYEEHNCDLISAVAEAAVDDYEFNLL